MQTEGARDQTPPELQPQVFFLPHFHLLHAQQEGLVHGLMYIQSEKTQLTGSEEDESHQGLHQRAATGGFSVYRAALSAHSGAFQRDDRPRGIFVMGFINKCTDLLNLSGCVPEINLG